MQYFSREQVKGSRSHQECSQWGLVRIKSLLSFPILLWSHIWQLMASNRNVYWSQADMLGLHLRLYLILISTCLSHSMWSKNMRRIVILDVKGVTSDTSFQGLMGPITELISLTVAHTEISCTMEKNWFLFPSPCIKSSYCWSEMNCTEIKM